MKTPQSKKMMFFLAIYKADEGGYWSRFTEFPAADQGETLQDTVRRPQASGSGGRRTGLHCACSGLSAIPDGTHPADRQSQSDRRNRRIRPAARIQPFRTDDPGISGIHSFPRVINSPILFHCHTVLPEQYPHRRTSLRTCRLHTPSRKPEVRQFC